jgi:hypothetical protein
MERGAWMKELTDPHELYGLSLDEFVPARAALVKSLRTDGQRDEAETASKLRKPSVAAWAVNQLVRTQPREITSLLEAGDALQAAQAELLGKRGDAKSLQAAVAREREAVSRLVERARGLLESKGQPPSQTILDRVSQTLEAAALDGHARGVVEAGCLERELQHIGLGAGGFSAQPAQPAAPTQVKSTKAGGSQESSSRAMQKRRERERAEQMKTDRKAEQDARRIAERADRELSQAQQRRDDAADALAEAEDQLAQARDRAERAADEHRQAEETVRQRKA